MEVKQSLDTDPQSASDPDPKSHVKIPKEDRVIGMFSKHGLWAFYFFPVKQRMQKHILASYVTACISG